VEDGLTTTPSTPDTGFVTLQKLVCDVANGTIGGPPLTTTDATALPVNNLYYYLVGHSNTTGAATSLGLKLLVPAPVGGYDPVRYAPAGVTCP